MRKAFLVLWAATAITATTATAFADSSFSAGIGTNFYRYDTTYLTALSATYLYELQDGLELNLGGEFGITTDENADGDTVPSFLIPVNVGLNFTFPQERVTFLFGTGLSPVFNFNPDTETEFRFLMGPYVKTALRVDVHPIMSWFVEAQQDLLIGGSDWINTGTRLSTGINFAFPRGSK
ncbi:MAG: hypothetical protein ACOCU4_06890 [Alkalispirochaeta sp.]